MMLVLLVDVVHGWTPANNAELSTAVGSCLAETSDGSCPDYAALNNKGVMSDWDTSKITNMNSCT